MNTSHNRRLAATLATASTIAAALTVVSAIGPTAASADRPDRSGAATHVGSAGAFDIGLYVAHRKSQMAQYRVDHAPELRERFAR